MTYNTWTHTQGHYTVEVDHDYDCHAYVVYDANNTRLGAVYPADVADSLALRAELDAGGDPIRDAWADGCGNTCSMGGWGGTGS